MDVFEYKISIKIQKFCWISFINYLLKKLLDEFY